VVKVWFLVACICHNDDGYRDRAIEYEAVVRKVFLTGASCLSVNLMLQNVHQMLKV